MEIDLTTLGFLSSSTNAFIKKTDNLTRLIPTEHPYFSVDNAISGKSEFPEGNRKILVDALKNQYRKLNIEDQALVNANIESLLEKDTYTVTTGQQLHLFMGPAFMIYKLISTIKTAADYEARYPGKKFIPVYWLASEDHDFEEIKNTPLFGQDFEWETKQEGACGSYHLRDLPPLFEKLKLKLANDQLALQIIDEYETIYISSENLSEATIKLTHRLFGHYGLLCLDAGVKELKQLFRPVIAKELTESRSDVVFNEFSEKFSKSNLSLQLKGRPVNLFYMKEGLRARLVVNGDHYSVHGTNIGFSRESMLEEVENNPEHFSPNALLRPVYQEMVLPNVTYIGGNAEINYWLQLKTVFELYKVSPPSLQLRQSVWMIRQKHMEWLESRNIQVKSLFDVKTDQDILAMVATTDANNPFDTLVSEFDGLLNRTLDMASKERLQMLKEVSVAGKAFEKTLKSLVRLKNDQLIGKNKKELDYLEKLLNNDFSTKRIQERTVYALEFMITVKDYIGFCHNNISANQGIGFFLPYK